MKPCIWGLGRVYSSSHWIMRPMCPHDTEIYHLLINFNRKKAFLYEKGCKNILGSEAKQISAIIMNRRTQLLDKIDHLNINCNSFNLLICSARTGWFRETQLPVHFFLPSFLTENKFPGSLAFPRFIPYLQVCSELNNQLWCSWVSLLLSYVLFDGDLRQSPTKVRI